MSGKKNHLSLEDRIVIEKGITNGSSQSAIAETLGKDRSTIGREIKSHRFSKKQIQYPVECALLAKCRPGYMCSGVKCPRYVPFHCTRRDKSPGACNGCEKYNSCHYNKQWYEASQAQREYEKTLVDARAGANLTTAEAKNIAEIIGPLLKQGQSLYSIRADHPELEVSERTLYTYVESGVLEQFGIIALDLRRQAGRKLSKAKAAEYKKRNDYRYLQGRKYQDYLEFMGQNPDSSVVQMDTVYNDGSTGPFMQTFKFIRYSVLIAIYHETRTGDDMVQGVDTLEQILGPELFRREVAVLLTDRGAEFTFADRFEQDSEGNIRTRVFYCDPMASSQKGSVENNHIELRYIFPKETNLKKGGLTSQENLNLALSHVNSASKESLNGKSPLEMMQFLAPDLYEKLQAFGIQQIKRDAVTLTPHLFN